MRAITTHTDKPDRGNYLKDQQSPLLRPPLKSGAHGNPAQVIDNHDQSILQELSQVAGPLLPNLLVSPL